MPNKKVTTEDIEFELKSDFEKGKALIQKLERSGELPKPKQPYISDKPERVKKKPKSKKKEEGDRERPYRRGSPEIPSGLPGSGRGS